MSGWVKLHRQFDQWEWYDDTNTKVVFIHLLLKANHSDKQWRGITIKRGDLITSYSNLSESLGMTNKQIRRCIDNLKSTKEVVANRAGNGLHLTVCKYNTYQGSETEEGQTKVNSKGTQRAREGQQLKNVKNDKNEKKKDIILDFGFSENVLVAIQNYKDHIKQLGRSHKKTDHAWKLFYCKVQKMINDHSESATVNQITQAIEGNWKTIYEPKEQRRTSVTKTANHIIDEQYSNLGF